MLVSLLLSLGVIVGSFFGLPFKDVLEDLLRQVNLSQSLLGGVLSFLLFAGALNIDLKQLREQRWRVFSLAFVSTLLSVALAAGLAYGVFRWLAVPIPFLYCLIFGALISPTDPIAVLSLLKNAHAPAALEVKIAGESSAQRRRGRGRLRVLPRIAPGHRPRARSGMAARARTAAARGGRRHRPRAGARLGGLRSHQIGGRLPRRGPAHARPGHRQLRPGARLARQRPVDHRRGGHRHRQPGAATGHERDKPVATSTPSGTWPTKSSTPCFSR